MSSRASCIRLKDVRTHADLRAFARGLKRAMRADFRRARCDPLSPLEGTACVPGSGRAGYARASVGNERPNGQKKSVGLRIVARAGVLRFRIRDGRLVELFVSVVLAGVLSILIVHEGDPSRLVRA